MSIREKFLRSSLLLGAAGAAALLMAATATAQQQGVETVTVTGTLLKTTSFDTASPLTVLSKDHIDMSGLTSTADVIRTLTADSSGTIPTAFSNGFAAGSSGVSLRGLTVSSTLVLINNRRTANYALADDGERSFVDLNTIPFGVVKEIQVLKDGASAMYGADAIGGVVNIIMLDEFEGVEGKLEAGTSEHGGGDLKRLEATVGWGSLAADKYSAYLHFEYEENGRIPVADRPFPFNTADLRAIGGVNNNGSTSIYGRAIPTYMGDQSNPESGGSAIGPSVVLASGGCGPLTTINFGTYCQQDASLYGDVQPKQRQFAVYGHASMNFGQNAQGYIDASFSGSDVVVKGAPRPARNSSPHNTSLISLPAYLANGSLNPNDPFAVAGCAGSNNPANPDPLSPNAGTSRCVDAILYYRFGDIPTSNRLSNRVLRVAAGLKGTFWGWDYDMGLVAAHSELQGTRHGFPSFTGLNAAIENGTYNFRNPAANSQAVRDAVSPLLSKMSTTDMDSFDIRVNRSVMDLPGGPLQIGFGAEMRHEATYDPDLNANLDTLGLGVAHTVGSRSIYSAYAEALVPLFKDEVIGTAEIDLAGRFDHYSDFGNSWVPKVTAQWQIVPQIKLRGTWSKGFRAPAFAENGSASATGFITVDPASYSAAWVAQHSASEYTIAYGFAQETRANPNIKPETSQSFTGGIVVTPFTDYDIRLSFDYYNVKKKNVIQPPPDFNTAIQAAFDGTPIPAGMTVTFDNPDPMFPAAPRRPVQVSAMYVNADWIETDGFDITLQAMFELDENLSYQTAVDVSQIMKYRVKTPTGVDNYVGLQSSYNLSSGAGTPRWRGSWSHTLQYGGTSLTGTFYLVSGEKEIGLDANGTACLYTGTPNTPAGDCKFGDFWTLDLNLQQEITDSIKLYGTIRNVFDKLPPVNPPNYAGVNWNPTYHQAGIVGRFFTFGIVIKQ